MARVGGEVRGRPWWSQTKEGRGLPRASQGSCRESPGSFLMAACREVVVRVNTGAATDRCRPSPGMTESETGKCWIRLY